MKYIGLLLTAVSLFVSCENKEDGRGHSVFLTSYIIEYVDGPFTACPSVYKGVPEISIYFGLDTKPIRYVSSEIGGTGESALKFREIAERNGDISYNRKSSFDLYVGNTCLSDNFTAVGVRCLNKAWDAAHPAGTPLDDVCKIHCSTYAPFVRSGYLGLEPCAGVTKHLTDLTESDLTMIVPWFHLYFDTCPESGWYEMEVTMTAVGGGVKTMTCTFEFE